MKKLLFLLGILSVLQANAQDYLINFVGTKGPVDLVRIENLTTGESVTLTGSDVLNLRGPVITGISDNHITQGIKIYPNPLISTNNTTVVINPPSPGNAVIGVYDMSGRQIAQIKSYMDNSTQEFRISNVNKGFYFVSVKASNYQLSGKIVSNRNSGGQTSIEKINSNLTFDVKELKSTKGIQNEGIIVMSYMPGDRLKFTAITDNNRSTLTDIPDKSKTISFELLSIVDRDSNNYHTVEMGEQVWMEENLKTTKYKDGTSIPLVSDNTTWSNLTTPSYAWYDHNKDSYKDPYGALYNGYTVGTGKICPTGWHIPTVDEWISMIDYLTINGFGYHGDQWAIAKSLASKSGWDVTQSGGGYPIPEGAVGKDPQYNNSSGFNGFSAGIRGIDGTFSGIGYTGVWYSSSGTSSLTDFSAYNTGVSLQQGDDNLTAGFSVRCIKGETKTLPNLITTNAYNITQTTAASGATYAGAGESPVTSRGVCWNTTGNKYPTIEDNKTADGTGTEPFTSLITGLIPGTVYYLRSYAINSDGISYGTLDVFTTKIADADGNVYNTLYLKDKIWMVENLKTTRYNDGTAIPLVTDNTAWAALSSSGYCYYNNDEITSKSIYGGLYNWNAVNTGKLCPIDWHVPADAEWTELVNFMAGDTYAGGRLKETGTEHWLSPNAEATNDKGFTALPGGSRDTNGTFNNIGLDGIWWSSTEYNAGNALYRNMNYNTGSILRNYNNKSTGFSVRCVKNGN